MTSGAHRQRRLSFWHGAIILAVAIAGLGLALTGGPRTDDPWEDGEERGQFRSVYNGYGTVTGDDDEMVLHPQSADNPNVTHGALVVTREEFTGVDFEVVMTTEQQVRQDPPNPWEVGWVLWNYTDDDHFYAVALKPNGWEISKQDPAYPGKQRYLATGNDPSFPLGERQSVSVTQTGNEMVVRVAGRILATVVDDERPYSRGAIGFYTEDARVRFQDLAVSPGN